MAIIELMELDGAAEAVWIAHGHVMNGGVFDCIDCLSKRELETAIQGYRIFDLQAAADVLSEAVSLSEEQQEEAEQRLNAAYHKAIPSDDVLEANINSRFPDEQLAIGPQRGESPVHAARKAFIEYAAQAVRLSTVPGKTRLQHRAHDRADMAVRELLRHWETGGHRALLSLLDHRDDAVRVSAAAYLVGTDRARAIAVLKELDRKKPPVSLSAMGTLFAIEHRTFVDPLGRLRSTL